MNRMYGINANCIVESEKVGNTKFIKKAGFDCFTFYHYLGIGKNADMADSLGLSFEHVYPLHLDANLLWTEGDATARVLDNMINACTYASNSSVRKVVLNIATDPTIMANEVGFAHFDAIIATAKSKKVRIAFRITSSVDLINIFAERYADNDTVGYCYDNSIGLEGVSDTVKSRIITANITDLNAPVEKLGEHVPYSAIIQNNTPEYSGMTKEEFLSTILEKLKALG